MRPGGRQVIPRPPAWEAGGPAPWAGRPAGPVVLDDVLTTVRTHERNDAPEFPGARHSAVLVALFDQGQGAEVILTTRAWHLSSHKGEVSFPGGRTDPGETAVQAALREAEEEILLDPRLVNVVGELDHLATVVSRSLIVPVVGVLDGPPEIAPGTNEVDRVLTVPLHDLLRDDTYRQEIWGAPPFDRPIHFFELDDETVWGATARILVQLLALATSTHDPGGW